MVFDAAAQVDGHVGRFRVQQLRFLAHTGPRPDPPSPLGLDGVHEGIVTAEFFPDIVIEAAVFSLNLRFGQNAFAIPREIGDEFGVVDEIRWRGAVVHCRFLFEASRHFERFRVGSPPTLAAALGARMAATPALARKHSVEGLAAYTMTTMSSGSARPAARSVRAPSRNGVLLLVTNSRLPA